MYRWFKQKFALLEIGKLLLREIFYLVLLIPFEYLDVNKKDLALKPSFNNMDDVICLSDSDPKEDESSVNLFKAQTFFIFFIFLHFGHPDPEGSGRVSRQDCYKCHPTTIFFIVSFPFDVIWEAGNKESI